MAELILRHTCGRCDGTGVDPYPIPPEAPRACESCLSEGSLYWGHADAIMTEFDEVDTKIDDLETKINDVIDKCNDIKEKVDEIKEVVDGL